MRTHTLLGSKLSLKHIFPFIRIHEYDITSNSCSLLTFATCKNYSSACMKLLKRNLHPKVQPIIKSDSPKQILQLFETVEIEINIKETNSQLITLAKVTLFSSL